MENVKQQGLAKIFKARIPIVIKHKLMQYCERTGLFYDTKAGYIIWHDICPETQNKSTMRVFLDYYRTKTGKELIVGTNRKKCVRVNFSYLFQIDHELSVFKDKGLVKNPIKQ